MGNGERGMTPKQLRCATYARYSSDQQREASIVDQQRNMARFSDTKGWCILPEFVFSDQAMSGAGADRPGLQALLSAALSKPKPFDVILVDDSSRVSRSLADTIRIREDLGFAGVRLVAVSQGIDSADEQADVMLTVHGLVDSLYIKELSKKTHRGLEGLALEGFHTGGNCYGYCNVKAGDKVRLSIDEQEAAVVRRIFEMSAAGMSLKAIAKRLNSEGITPPRGSKRKVRPSWVYTAIREMLRRELYIGRIVWNKRKYLKRPGTNKRISIMRPESEWVTVEEPSLRIVSHELWESVQAGLHVKAKQYAIGVGGLMNRAASARYLFSGILKCAECGSNLTIISARGKDRRTGYYGCPGHLHRGICSNNVSQRRDLIEKKLLEGVRELLLDASAIDYAVAKLKKGFDAEEEQEQAKGLLKRKAQLQLELERLGDAIAQSGGSKFLLEVLRNKEKELEQLARTVAELDRVNVAVDLKWLKRRVTEEINEISTLLNLEPERARAYLLKHVSEIRMQPSEEDGERFYVAEGEWLMGANEKVTGAMLNGDFRSVAGAGFEPATFGL
jgi:site-specific DNA recombinase